VKPHATAPWGVLSSARWWPVPAPEEAGGVTARAQGTPPGGGMRPLRAPLWRHSACDVWRRHTSPRRPLARDADEAIGPGRTAAEAQEVRGALAARRQACRRELPPEKTTIVEGQDAARRGTDPHAPCDFLGETFRPRQSKHGQGPSCLPCSPAVADRAGQARRAERRHGQLPLRRAKSLAERSRMFTPQIRGWLPEYGRYDRAARSPSRRPLARSRARWASRKSKKRRGPVRRATPWIARISRRDPGLFAHGQMGVRRGSTAGAV
jgi:hypothetical protein